MLLGQRHLCVLIGDWQISLNLFPEDKTETGRRILLIGETQRAHFLWSQHAEIEVLETVDDPEYKALSTDDGEKYLEYGHAQKFEADEKSDIPTHIQCLLRINRARFERLLDLLKGALAQSGRQVELAAGLFGLDLGVEIDLDKWPDGAILSLTEVEFHAGPAESV